MPQNPDMYPSVRSSPSFDDDSSTMSMANTTWIPQQMLPPYQQSPSVETSSTSSHPIKPLLKRRRVTRACDECRRKKIKCDGKHPCTHCTVYSYDCTYDQPSNRRRNPGPQYIEGLEKDKHQLATLIRLIRPDLDPFEPNFDVDKLISELQDSGRRHSGSMSESPHDDLTDSSDGDSLLESMVEAAGRLEIDETGAVDFHGHSSSIAFLARLRYNFQKVLGSDITSTMKTTFPGGVVSPGPTTAIAAEITKLPVREVADILVECCFEDACALMRFIHRPSFDRSVDRIYNIPRADWNQNDKRFLPLLYLSFAVGYLFAGDREDGVMRATSEGTKYFLAGRCMIEITDCRDIMSIQAVILMIIFLQSSTKMSTCYSYVGIALSAALRMGLHRTIELNMTPIERETRKRIFWTVRKMDTYVSALLGLPKGIADEDIDQEMPLEIDDEYITDTEILPIPKGVLPIMTAANAHTRLLKIMAKVVKAVYPLKPGSAVKNTPYSVGFASIREIENDLKQWSAALPDLKDPNLSPRWKKCRHLLEMAFNHVKMMMYRPFIHYICAPLPHRNNASMAARNCIHTAINVVHLAESMREQNVMNGAYWFSMYTTFFATVSLLFFVLERPNESGSAQCWKAAKTGRDALECLKLRSFAADRCSVALKQIFDSIPAKLIETVEREEVGMVPSQNVEEQARNSFSSGPWNTKPQFGRRDSDQRSDHMETLGVCTNPPSISDYSPSDHPSSVATPDAQLQYPNMAMNNVSDMSSMMMYGGGAPHFYGTGMNMDVPASNYHHSKAELTSPMDTDTTLEHYPRREMMYELESQARPSWAPYNGQLNRAPTTELQTSADFDSIDINSANSNLMMLQGQTYGAMPGGGSAMGLEDFFGDEWADHMLQQQMFRS
ncbi:fungal-specific transcription factor [Peziza echinospora]|nr:fungal-specific transcription factor [Peziza echinospora]